MSEEPDPVIPGSMRASPRIGARNRGSIQVPGKQRLFEVFAIVGGVQCGKYIDINSAK
jgi:hypothetical protein